MDAAEAIADLLELSSQVEAAVLFGADGSVEASLPGGGLVVVREGERLAAATTVAEPPSALVLYDLRTALRASAAPPPKPRRPRKAKAPADA